MRIVFVSIFYPVFMGGYFLGALQRRKDVELYTVGPYTGDFIPWKGGMTVKHRFEPDRPLPQDWLRRKTPIQMIEAFLPWEPDLWIQVDAGFHLDGKPKHGFNAIVGTDPHCLDYTAARAVADKFFCMQLCYEKEGDYYLPYAHDPILHAREEREKEYDACLVGLQYPQRTHWVEALRAKGRKVFYDTGPSYEDARALYGASRVGLNWSSLDDLNARAFELLGYGIPAVMNTVPDIDSFFVAGRDYLPFKTLDEAVKQVEWALENPKEATLIAENGRRAVAPHTWDARVEELLNVCNA